MTPLNHARRLVTLSGWEWAPPMMAILSDGSARISWHDLLSGVPPEWLPDLDDDATRGIVLGMLSRRVGGYVWIEPTGWRSGVLTWDARCQMPHGTRRVLASGASWAEAFVRAWEATPPRA